MYTIGTVVKFETAHRQKDDPSKCGYLHGHNWKAKIEITSKKLGPLGYVIDFKAIKDVINLKFDHRTLLSKDDVELIDVLERAGQKIAIIMGGNPTCEVLAKSLLDSMVNLFNDPRDLILVKVRLYENDDSFAEVFYP